jgi:hypothetical protein
VPSISVPLPSDLSLPVTLPSDLGSLPAQLGNFCASSTSASTTALTYVGAAEIGSAQIAQGCVYQDTVSPSVTQSISGGSIYSPQDIGGGGPVFHFTSIDGKSQLTVTVARQSDGKFYVVKVVKS